MQAETLAAVPAFPDPVPVVRETLEPQPAAPRGFADEVAKIREGFRDTFAPKPPKTAPKPANDSRETLHVTRPKKSSA